MLNHKNSWKGQTTLIFIALVAIIFIGIAIFLLTFISTMSGTEHANLYASNMLLSIMRTDTGETEPECKKTEDLVSCAFLSPSHICGFEECRITAEQKLEYYISEFADKNKAFRYLFIAKPEGFVVSSSGGMPYRIIIGDTTLEEEKIEKWTVNEKIYKISQSGTYIIDVSLIIARRE